MRQAVLAGAAFVSVLMAQTRPPRGVATPYNALVSPEVHADRTVTLRFRAPDATRVGLTGEITQGKSARAIRGARTGSGRLR